MDLDKIKQIREEEALQREKQANMLLDVTLNKGVRTQVAESGKATQQALERATQILQSATDQTTEQIADALGTLTIATHATQQKTVAQLEEINRRLSALPQEYPDIPQFPQFPEIPKPLDAVSVKNLSEVTNWLKKVLTAIEKIKLNPVIEVKPEITVPAIEVPAPDLSSLIKVLEKSDKPSVKTIDLDEYKASDLVEDDAFQYVGFVAPGGGWYIIENDIRGGSMRYKFGSKGYKTAWKNRISQTYRLLDEAIREVQT